MPFFRHFIKMDIYFANSERFKYKNIQYIRYIYLGVNMFESKCKQCEAVYTIEEATMPQAFECLCGCKDFNIKENTLLIA